MISRAGPKIPGYPGFTQAPTYSNTLFGRFRQITISHPRIFLAVEGLSRRLDDKSPVKTDPARPAPFKPPLIFALPADLNLPVASAGGIRVTVEELLPTSEP